MTYKKNFVACIKVNGQILRESNDRVELPFGSEYSILLKNLDSVRMQARISIDGQDATGWLIVEPGRDIDVERFVRDLDRGNRFKFIERTARIGKFRGVRADDGLVRVEFKREKVFDPPKLAHYDYHYHYYPGGCWPWYSGIIRSSAFQANQNVFHSMSCASGFLAVTNMSKSGESASFNEIGVTVPGSISSQKFISVGGFETENPEVIVLHLVGKTASKLIKAAKTVKTKIECETCGKKNKSSAKFCVECGTSLEKV